MGLLQITRIGLINYKKSASIEALFYFRLFVLFIPTNGQFSREPSC